MVFWFYDDVWRLGATGARACRWNAVLLLDPVFDVAGLHNLALVIKGDSCVAMLIGL